MLFICGDNTEQDMCRSIEWIVRGLLLAATAMEQPPSCCEGMKGTVNANNINVEGKNDCSVYKLASTARAL